MQDDLETDSELLEAVAKGDRFAFRRLWERHAHPLLVYLISLTGGRESAEDILQQAFIAVLAQPDRFGQTEDFRPYLFRAARNLLTDEKRKKSAHVRSLEDAERLFVPDPSTSPATQAALADSAKKLEAVVRELHPELCQVILLHNYSDMTFKEIGKALGVPEKTVFSRYQKALQTLKGKLDETFEL